MQIWEKKHSKYMFQQCKQILEIFQMALVMASRKTGLKPWAAALSSTSQINTA